MREKMLVASMVLVAILMEAFPNIEAQDVAAKTQQILNQARTAIGGDKLKSITSLSATGTYRRILGDREMSGEVQYDLILADKAIDKLMRSETMSPVPSMEVTRIDVVNGTTVWSDQQTSGGGGNMIMIRRPAGDSPNAAAMEQQRVRADFARTTIAWLLSTPSAFPVEYSYGGEAESPDGKADVLEVKGPDGFSARLFLDQKTHKPLMLTYKGRKPRIIMRTMSGPPSSREDHEKSIKDAEEVAAREPEVEFQINYTDYRDVNGLSLPHRLTKAVEGQVNEEMEITKFKINPALKPEKFEKK